MWTHVRATCVSCKYGFLFHSAIFFASDSLSMATVAAVDALQ
jgi:hypothetical protein